MRKADEVPNPKVFANLASEAKWEFGLLLDYVWKAPMLLETLKAIELRKLHVYFPDNPYDQALRWRLESDKLGRTFPHLIAQGNLFLACSLFEIYLLRLVREISMVASDKVHAQGLRRHLEFLRHVGVDTTKADQWHQVTAIFKIRNCLMHASGILNSSRDSQTIRQVIESRTCLSPSHRESLNSEEKSARVEIVSSPLGEKLEINNVYALLACAYLRDCFDSLCHLTCEVLRRKNDALSSAMAEEQ